MKKKSSLVVVGGGFGGVAVVKKLLKQGEHVTLISETNFFTFTPLLHEVATGILTSDDITFEYSSFFKNKRFTFLRGHVDQIDFEKQVVLVGETEIPYRDVVMAMGASTNFYQMEGRAYVHELKTITDAGRLKKRMIELGQGAEQEVFVNVIGGGPTGVELVFEMNLFLRELKKLNPALKVSIRLIQAAPVLLPMFSEKIQRHVKQKLHQEKVEVLVGAFATRVTATTVETSQGVFPSNLTVMVAGVLPNVACIQEDAEYLDKGHVCVDSYLRVRDVEHAFALGDIITMEGVMIPKLAQVALEQAEVVAENIEQSKQGGVLRSYVPHVRGLLISFGYRDGAGEFFGMTFSGFFAWFLWRTVYLFKTPGLSNKLRVAFSWTVELFQRRNLAEE